MRRVTLVTMVLALAWFLGAGGQSGVEAGQPLQDELPEGCELTSDRTVTPNDVLVNETVHVKITVDGGCEGSSRGLDLFLVVDRTITMRSEGYLADTQEALKNFVNRIDFTKSEAGLITFASGEQVNLNLTSDRDAVIQQINSIRVFQETDVRGLQEAFRTATQKLDNDGSPENEKLIIIVVAGQDVNQQLLNMPTVTQAARNAGVKVVFMMFPNARFTHYVDAASDCEGLSICQRWQGPRGGTISKWAWGVDPTNIDSVFQGLANVLISAVDFSLISINEALDPGAAMVETSIQPPITRSVGPPFRDVYWEWASMPPGGITIEYDAEMVYPDETYPVTVASVLRVDFNNGFNLPVIDLPNPPITVHGAASPTPTIGATDTSTPETPTAETPTPETPTADTPTPTATATDDTSGEYKAYLPWIALKYFLP